MPQDNTTRHRPSPVTDARNAARQAAQAEREARAMKREREAAVKAARSQHREAARAVAQAERAAKAAKVSGDREAAKRLDDARSNLRSTAARIGAQSRAAKVAAEPHADAAAARDEARAYVPLVQAKRVEVAQAKRAAKVEQHQRKVASQSGGMVSAYNDVPGIVPGVQRDYPSLAGYDAGEKMLTHVADRFGTAQLDRIGEHYADSIDKLDAAGYLVKHNGRPMKASEAIDAGLDPDELWDQVRGHFDINSDVFPYKGVIA